MLNSNASGWLLKREATLSTRALFFPTDVMICAILPCYCARLSSFPSGWLMGTAAAAACSRAASGAILFHLATCHFLVQTLCLCHIPVPVLHRRITGERGASLGRQVIRVPQTVTANVRGRGTIKSRVVAAGDTMQE